MTTGADHFSDALRDALRPGTIFDPAPLFAAIEAVDDRSVFFDDWDRVNDLYAVVETESQTIELLKRNATPPQPAAMALWASLLRWLLHALGERYGGGADERRLIAMLVISQIVDVNGLLWEQLPPDFTFGEGLAERLQSFLTVFKVSFDAQGFGRVPVWEREAVDAFERADAAGDWTEIAKGLVHFQQRPLFCSVLRAQAAQCLYRCDKAALSATLDTVKQTIAGLLLADALPHRQSLELASKCASHHFQFAAIYHLLHNHPASNVLPDTESSLLAQLLSKVGRDLVQWDAWMRVFNCYPLRHRTLQEPLGHALSRLSDAAILSYVNSIALYPAAKDQPFANGGRANVALCLATFRNSAPLERRAFLWSAAHTRWALWSFDRENADTHLFCVSQCELDYAIVGYAIECIDEAGRERECKMVLDCLKIADAIWHSSSTSAVTHVHRLLSVFQPFAHASNLLRNGGDWLQSGAYLPFDPQAEGYMVKKYRMEWAARRVADERAG